MLEVAAVAVAAAAEFIKHDLEIRQSISTAVADDATTFPFFSDLQRTQSAAVDQLSVESCTK